MRPKDLVVKTLCIPLAVAATMAVLATGCAVPAPAGHKVLVIIEENHTASAVQSGMPYLVSLGNRYGHTTNDVAAAHPSLPNYLAISGGSTFGVSNNSPPSSHPIAGTSVFGTGGRSYEQTMKSNCQTSMSGAYAVKHNPQPYYTGETANCASNNKLLTALPRDLVTGLASVSLMTPDLNNDAHDGTLAQADTFLKTWVPKIMAGADYRAGRLTIVVTFDEGVGSSQTVYTAVINPTLHGRTVTTRLTHYSLARWLYRAAAKAPQHNAATAVDMGAQFGL
jgi:phosphatidylinositol-3-phosphatase